MTKMTKTIRAADLFCGAGGTSSGLSDACAELGYRLRLLAVNHWPVAIETHSANHPYAEHLCENLDVVDPRKVVPGGRLDILIASPECTHHSNARGGKPMSDQSRASAWHVTRWAEALHVSNILIENVREFRNWGALDSRGRPIKRRKGELYHAFLNALRAMGYTLEDRILNAADYGDPTSRRRLFILARKGNRRVHWPDPTHVPHAEPTLFGSLPRWRTARQIIDWGMKGNSVFNRVRPLSKNTMARIFAGLHKFGGLPFVVPNEGFYRGNQPRSVDDPIPTITSRGAGGVAQPYLVKLYNTNDAASVDEPLPTVTAQGNHLALAEPFILAIRGGDDGYTRGAHVDAPLPALTTSPALGLVEPFIVATNHSQDNSRTYPVDNPIPTITSVDAWGLIQPYLVEYYTERQGQDARISSLDDPLKTVTTQNRFGLAQPFIVKYYSQGQGAESIDEPLDTITGRDRFGLAVPVQNGLVIVDILFRMLQPHELARAHSFGDSYWFAGTREEKVKQIGNSVPRNLSKALCLAALRSDTKKTV